VLDGRITDRIATMDTLASVIAEDLRAFLSAEKRKTGADSAGVEKKYGVGTPTFRRLRPDRAGSASCKPPIELSKQ